MVVSVSKAEVKLETNSTWHLVENDPLLLGPALAVNNANALNTIQLILNVSAGGFRNNLSTASMPTLHLNDTSENINNALHDWKYIPPLHWNSRLGDETLSLEARIMPDWNVSRTISMVVWAKSDAPVIHPLNSTIIYGMEDELPVLEGVIFVEDADATEDPSGVIEIMLFTEYGTVDILTGDGLWIIQDLKVRDGNGHTLIFRGSIANVNEALNGLSYTGPENWSGVDTLTIHVNDAGNTGLGGMLTAHSSIDIIFEVVNDAPQIQAPFSVLEMDEDEVLPLKGITIFDEEAFVNSSRLQVSVTLHNLGACGTLNFPSQVEGVQLITGKWSTSTHIEFLALPQAIPILLDDLTFTPFPNVNELSCGLTTIEWSVSDLGCCGAGVQGTNTWTLRIRVRTVNDAPTLRIPPYFNIQQGELEALPGIVVEDIEARENPTSLIQVNVTVENGSLQFLKGGHNNAGLWIENDGSNGFLKFVGAIDLVNAAFQTLSYRGFNGWSGADRLTVNVHDFGSAGSSGALTVTQSSVINVRKSPRIIVISAPLVLEVEEGGKLPLSQWVTTSVLVPEVLFVMLCIEVSNGKLETSFQSSSFSNTQSYEGRVLELAIPVSDIEGAISNISYIPSADWHGVDNLRIYMHEYYNQADGGVVTPLLSSFIHIISTPDAPRMNYSALDSQVIFTRGSRGIPIEGLGVADADANSETAELIHLNATSVSGEGILQFRRGIHVYGLSFPAGDLYSSATGGCGHNASLVAMGTDHAINTALQELFYKSNSWAQADSDTIEVTVSRSGLSSVARVPVLLRSSQPISIQGVPSFMKVSRDNLIYILSDLEVCFHTESIADVLLIAQLHSSCGTLTVSLPISTMESTFTSIETETSVSDGLYFQVGAVELQAALREVIYGPPSDWSGVAYITISLALVSPPSSQHLPLNFTIEVVEDKVYNPPVLLAPETFEGLENEPLLFTGLDILEGDARNSLPVEVIVRVKVTHGELTLGVMAAEVVQFIQEDKDFASFRANSISQAKLIVHEISYLGNSGWSGEDALEWSVNSIGNKELGGSDEEWKLFSSSRIVIHPMNGPPSIEILNWTIETFQGQQTPVKSTFIQGVDDLVMSVKLEAAHGFLSFAIPIPEDALLTEYSSYESGSSLVLNGSITVINQLLSDSLMYSSKDNYLGIDWIRVSAITVRITEQGERGSENDESEQHFIRVLVHGINDPLAMSFGNMSTISTAEDESVTFGGCLEISYNETALQTDDPFLTLNVSTVYGSVTFPPNIIISSLHVLKRDPHNILKEGEGGWWAALGPLSSLNDAKDFLAYCGPADWSGNDTITVCLTTSKGLESKATISVNVVPVNDYPVISKPVLPFLHVSNMITIYIVI